MTVSVRGFPDVDPGSGYFLRLRGFAIESGECNERVTSRQENIT
jgi:hypothetical protein